MKWDIPTRQPNFRLAALERQSVLTKPTGALGVMEDIAVWLADIQQSKQPQSTPAAAIVFASDHPVSHLGVSAYPREVTPMMVINLATGGAAASVLARFNGMSLDVVDVGSEPYPPPIPAEGVRWCRKDVGGVVGDLVTTDAMDDT
ncbi:MAG: nicotinate-nucleotide--dimethylbenzimidazole phosphoribosyltransferase, partial [Verrucomicrobiota bacterium]|nr:nicotinate-nucleotide--dimethylbenzimidazole phosphoribosyltransferase [Verrucomicrobiota bacterium]